MTKGRVKCEILPRFAPQDDRPKARSFAMLRMTNPRSLALLGMTDPRSFAMLRMTDPRSLALFGMTRNTLLRMTNLRQGP